MKRRALALLLLLFYSAGSLLLGLWPHHHQHTHFGFDPSCAACVWQVTNATDAPAESATPVIHVGVIVFVLPASVVEPATEFAASTASRAPPAALV